MSRIERRQQEELEKLRQKEMKRANKSKPSPKKIAMIVVASLLAVVGVALAGTYFYVNSKLDLIEEAPFVSDVESYGDYDLSCVDVDGFINILILGVDARDMNDTKADEWRSDAIMIASIKENTGDVYLTSIYRDTILPMGNEGFYDKITHAFTYGGVRETMTTINKSLDLNITNYVIFNFNSAADVVDAMGGLELDIEEYEISELNHYTEETWNICGRKGSPKVVTSPGSQLVDGCTAVSYGRIRKGVGDDYKRTERMRILVTKMLEKVKTLSFKEIDKLLDVGLPQIKTNLSNSDIMGIAFKSLNYRIAGTTGFPYNVADGFVGGVSYVFPSSLYDDVAKLHEEFFGQVSYKPSNTVIEASETLLRYLHGADSDPGESYIDEEGAGYGGTNTWDESYLEYDDSDYVEPTYEESSGTTEEYHEESSESTEYSGEESYSEPAVEEHSEESSGETHEESYSESSEETHTEENSEESSGEGTDETYSEESTEEWTEG